MFVGRCSISLEPATSVMFSDHHGLSLQNVAPVWLPSQLGRGGNVPLIPCDRAVTQDKATALKSSAAGSDQINRCGDVDGDIVRQVSNSLTWVGNPTLLLGGNR